MTPKIYPGMLDSRIEYFREKNNVFTIKNGKVSKFDDVKEHPELEKLLNSEPRLKETLQAMTNNSRRKMLKKLAECRFGGLNFEPDFCETGNPTHDYIDCPLRGNCIGENIVCKPPVINGSPISKLELQILRACVTDRKNTAIASDLNLAEGTFNVLQTQTYKRAGVHTKQHLALTLVEKGLL